MKKDDQKKKKKLPFYGRAYGGAARSRADRKAYRRGGSVKPTTELLSPNEPKAPASGKVEQHFKKGGVAKRAAGGATAKRLDTDDDSRPTPVGDVIGGAERFNPGPQAGAPTVEERFQGRKLDLPLIMPNALRRDKGAPLYQGYQTGPRGLKKGGVAKRADGGDCPVPTGTDAGLSAGGGYFPASAPGGTMGNAIAGALMGPGGPTANFRPMKKGGAVKLANGGKLSAAQRQSLPKSDFALPGRGSGPKGAGSGSYPINNPSHARNALARSSGKPEAAEVRAKVKAKYPDMGD